MKTLIIITCFPLMVAGNICIYFHAIDIRDNGASFLVVCETIITAVVTVACCVCMNSIIKGMITKGENKKEKIWR